MSSAENKCVNLYERKATLDGMKGRQSKCRGPEVIEAESETNWQSINVVQDVSAAFNLNMCKQLLCWKCGCGQVAGWWREYKFALLAVRVKAEEMT